MPNTASPPLRSSAASLAILVLLAGPAAAGLVTVGSGVTVDLGSGKLDTGEGDIEIAGALSAGSQGFEARDVNVQLSGVLNGDSALLALCGNWNNAGTFNSGSSTVAFVDGCGAASNSIAGSNAFHHLSITTTSGRQVDFAAGVTQTIAGTLTLDGAPGSLLVLRSDVNGSQAFLDLDSAATGQFVDVKDVHAIDEPVALGHGSFLSGNTVGWFLTLALPALTLLGLAALAASLVLTARRRV